MFTIEEKAALDKIKQISNIDARLSFLIDEIRGSIKYPQEIFNDYVRSTKQELKERKNTINNKEKELNERELFVNNLFDDKSEALLHISSEITKGFPWLANAFSDYSYLQYLKLADYLESKNPPAPETAKEIRKVISKKRKIIEYKLRVTQYILKYLLNLFPFLEEFMDEVDSETLMKILSRNIEEPIFEISEIGIDPVKVYLSAEEYSILSSTERNQLALDRYWSKSKNKWEIGRGYERYVGYLYEIDGYTVYYQGILEGYDDLGRDLVCKKDDKAIIVQCKCWSEHKTIHEKHVNQLYGTTIKYKIDNPLENVFAALCTSTKLSDRAKEFANYLNIGISEKLLFDTSYPSIKCNISKRNGEKIYHLLFDQQYDRTIIENEKNEFYAKTVAEAENKGFRRAWRWKGNINKQ